MFKQVFSGEKNLTGLVFANISLGGVQAFLHSIQPVLTAGLTLIQITVGVLTVLHIVRKWIQYHKKKNEIIHPDSP